MGYWLGITFSCLDVLCVAVFCDAFLERKTRGLRFVVGALLCGVLSYIATQSAVSTVQTAKCTVPQTAKCQKDRIIKIA